MELVSLWIRLKRCSNDWITLTISSNGEDTFGLLYGIGDHQEVRFVGVIMVKANVTTRG